MKIKKAIITAAGFGSRFLPITKTIPKEMLPIVDRPIIHWIVKECAEATIEEIIIVAAPDEVKTFEDYFYGHGEAIKRLMYRQGKIDRWKKVEEIFSLPLITVIPEDRTMPYGNGRPILSAKDLVEGENAFIICWGDDLVLSDISAVKQLVEAYDFNSDGVIGLQEVSDEQVTKVGIAKFKDGSTSQIDYLVEKPELESAPTRLGSYGRYLLSPKIFDFLTPSATGKDNEIWLPDAIDKLAKSGSVYGEVINGEWLTTGDPDNYLIAQNKFYNRYVK